MKKGRKGIQQKQKAGAELTMNTIMIAALALIVLLVLAYVFKDNIGKTSGQFNDVTKTTGDCLKDPTNPDCKLTKPAGTSRFSPDIKIQRLLR